jgi:hypothetical protein
VIAGGAVVCGASGTCQLGTSPDGGPGRSGLCLAAAVDGQACDGIVGPACLPPARCILANPDGGSGGSCLLPSQMGCH